MSPRESDSRPIAPDPAKRSQTLNPSNVPNSEDSEEKRPSRARSDVGLVACATVPKFLPFATPAIIRNYITPCLNNLRLDLVATLPTLALEQDSFLDHFPGKLNRLHLPWPVQ